MDFGAISRTVSVLRGLGMKYQLGFGAGVHTPPYVYTEGAQPTTHTMELHIDHSGRKW